MTSQKNAKYRHQVDDHITVKQDKTSRNELWTYSKEPKDADGTMVISYVNELNGDARLRTAVAFGMVLAVLLLLSASQADAFSLVTLSPSVSQPRRRRQQQQPRSCPSSSMPEAQKRIYYLKAENTENDDKTIDFPVGRSSPAQDGDGKNDGGGASGGGGESSGKAVTNTINERLMTELQEAVDKEKYGPRSSAGKKYGLVDGFGRARKSDEEIKAAIAEARDLNGVNPLVALAGGVFALGAAAVLWWSTSQLGLWFATHPPQTDVYFVQRAAQVFRNVAMGMISLASGFFGVTGLGILLLGVRVAYGVITGELDPTPIKPSVTAAAAAKEKQEAVQLGRIMDLMMNKKPNRRRNSK